MTEPRKAKSRLLEAVHETASDLHRLGFMEDSKMREFDTLCLCPVPAFDGAKIRALRERHHLSQALLAAVLNTDAATVRRWEIDQRRPSGPYRKLLDLLDRKGLDAVM
jgi:putative transcriptional regulator